jgi:hypothetical protein
VKRHLCDPENVRKVYPLPDTEPEPEELLRDFPAALLSPNALEYMRETGG